jgi:hypothetical protein
VFATAAIFLIIMACRVDSAASARTLPLGSTLVVVPSGTPVLALPAAPVPQAAGPAEPAGSAEPAVPAPVARAAAEPEARPIAFAVPSHRATHPKPRRTRTVVIRGKRRGHDPLLDLIK